MVVEVDIAGSLAVGPNEVSIARRPLVLRVAGQHALEAHAHALDVLDGAPALRAEQVKTYDAIRVDMGVNGDRPVGQLKKDDLGWLFSPVSGGGNVAPQNNMRRP